MQKMKSPLSFETAFSQYSVTGILGEGGSGRVYAATSADGVAVAIKLLAADRTTNDKRRRFKNELGFLLQNRHHNIVSVIDHGLSQNTSASGPFYVMRRFDHSLRALLSKGMPPDEAFALFGHLLNGVEAAHLQGVVHRDLKPENLLYDSASKTLAVADFGVASFTDDLLVTLVETGPAQRLANFQYAAPEQRIPGRTVTATADLYAIGLITNEMFTREVPHGTDYKTVASVAPDFAFLDPLISILLRQEPSERLGSIELVKQHVQRYRAENVARQKLSVLSKRVVPVQEIEDSLALDPPRLISVDWNAGTLTLQLDRPVNQDWVQALGNMGNYTSVLGRGPERFSFQGDRANVQADDHQVQQIVNHFKDWLPKATSIYRYRLEQDLARTEAERKRKLAQERQEEERRLRVLQNTKI